MPKRAITRCSVFVDASLKRQLDAINEPRLRTTMPNCICGARDWTPCASRVVSEKEYYTCGSCSRRRSANRFLASVTSAIDGNGTADIMVQEYLASPRRLQWHIPKDRVMINLYIPNKLHQKAHKVSDGYGVTLSCLLASIIAAKVSDSLTVTISAGYRPMTKAEQRANLHNLVPA